MELKRGKWGVYMIGILFGINTILALAVAFATTMLQNHFSKIEKSIEIYHNPKAYKTGSEIAFIRDLTEKYQKAYEVGESDHIDIEAMIQAAFYEKKVGKFPYYVVQNIAIKSKLIMWIVLCIQIVLEILSTKPGYSISNFIFIVVSTVLCIMITLLGIFKDIHEQREQLFIKLQDYVRNTYPTEIKWIEKQKDVKVLLDKIEKLETELQEYQQAKVVSSNEKHIREEDIKMLLSQIDIKL